MKTLLTAHARRRPLTALVVVVAFVVIAVLVVTLAIRPSGPHQRNSETETAPRTVAACDRDIGEALGAWADEGFSGSIAISTRGELRCLAGYGWADRESRTPNTADTVFAIGSVSKAFTAAAALHLVDSGRLTLEDRAGEIVPDLRGPAADVTIEQLLLHTSGLTGTHGEDHVPLDRDDAVAAISRLERAFEPGSDYLYSNSGYTLLALVVEELADGGYRDHMASEILPLPGGSRAGGFWDGPPAAPGPRAVGYGKDGPTGQTGNFSGPHWALSGNGDLAMTAEELARWTHALFTGRVVSPASTEVIATPRVAHDDASSETPGWVAFEEDRFGEPMLMAAGGGDIGHNVVVGWLPESERVFVVTSNTPDVTAEELVRVVGPALVADEPLPVPEGPPAEVSSSELAAAEGTYTLDTGGTFDVTAEDDGLTVSADGADAVAALFPPSGGFTAEDVAAHEERVRTMLEGGTEAGRTERETLESEFGPIEGARVEGTVVEDGELHTYTTVTFQSRSLRLWYALDEAGGIAAAHGPADPPSLTLVPTGGGQYRPDGLPDERPRVRVAIQDGRMTLSGPSGGATARTTTTQAATSTATSTATTAVKPTVTSAADPAD